jgi:hypothetical protein
MLALPQIKFFVRGKMPRTPIFRKLSEDKPPRTIAVYAITLCANRAHNYWLISDLQLTLLRSISFPTTRAGEPRI